MKIHSLNFYSLHSLDLLTQIKRVSVIRLVHLDNFPISRLILLHLQKYLLPLNIITQIATMRNQEWLY